MDVARYEIDDPNFIEDLEDSKEFVWMAARWLSELGYNVTIKPTFVRPSVENMGEYSDNGDLEIVQRVEVKHRPDIEFTSKESFPYPTIIVDVAHVWDRAKPKPFAYIIFNADASGCLVVKGSTNNRWEKVSKFDTKKNRQREFYECPLELCEYYSIA
jgi:hypothetical protein